MNCHYLFVLLFSVSVGSVAGDFLPDVKKMVDSFGHLASATTDLAVTLKKITPKRGAFLKTLPSVSSLVMTGVEIFIKPESDEFRALKVLHRLATHKFHEIQRSIESNLHALQLTMHYMHYLNNVILSIDNIRIDFHDITNPAPGHRTNQSRAEFVSKCTSDRSPKLAVHFLNRVANLDCEIPSRRQAKQHSKLREIFRQLDQFVKQNSEYENHKKIFFEAFARANSYDREILFESFEENILAMNATTPRSVVQAIVKTLYDTVSDDDGDDSFPTGCILDSIAETNNWHRPIIYAAVDTIRLHALQLAVIQGACINVSTNGNPVKMGPLFDELFDEIGGIFEKMSKWLPKKLEMAWPDATIQNAKDMVSSDIPPETFNATANQTAQLIMQAADITGQQGFVHAVIITQSDYDTTDWYYEIPTCGPSGINRCASAKNFHMVNFAIFRYPLGSEARMRRAREWFQRKQFRIKRTIAESFNYLDDLEEIFEKIRKKVPDIIGSKLFNNGLFLHNYKFFKSDCIIQVGIGVMPIGSMEPIRVVEYFWSDPNPPFFVFRYRLYLVL